MTQIHSNNLNDKYSGLFGRWLMESEDLDDDFFDDEDMDATDEESVQKDIEDSTVMFPITDFKQILYLTITPANFVNKQDNQLFSGNDFNIRQRLDVIVKCINYLLESLDFCSDEYSVEFYQNAYSVQESTEISTEYGYVFHYKKNGSRTDFSAIGVLIKMNANVRTAVQMLRLFRGINRLKLILLNKIAHKIIYFTASRTFEELHDKEFTDMDNLYNISLMRDYWQKMAKGQYTYQQFASILNTFMGDTCFDKFTPLGFDIDNKIIKKVMNLASSSRPQTPVKKLHIDYGNYNVDLLFKLVMECHPGSKEVNAMNGELDFAVQKIDDCKKLMREQKIGLNIYFKVDGGDDLYIIYITDRPVKTEDGKLIYISINSRNDIRKMCKEIDEAGFASAFFMHIKNLKILKKIYEIMDKSDYMPLYDYDAYLKKVEEIIKNNDKRVY